jgi:hypothetical protein
MGFSASFLSDESRSPRKWLEWAIRGGEKVVVAEGYWSKKEWGQLIEDSHGKGAEK